MTKNRLMKRINCLMALISILFLLTMFSCDTTVGIEGTVIDKTTAEKLEGVIVTMNSYYGEIIDTTDLNGYFSTEQSYGCGIRKCDESFEIVFERDDFMGIGFNEKSIIQCIEGNSYIIAMDSLREFPIDICCEEK